MRVTVAICTWNRCESLRRTLDRIASIRIPPGLEWELVVVNNRSTDDTDDVIGSFSDRLPIRRLWEPEPGLANARNRALTEATGDYIIWTDDDVLVDDDWLVAYVQAFRRWPDADLFGGPIEPVFEGEPPPWIPRVMEWIGPVFGRQTLGSEPVRLTREILPYGPYGGNMAMRRESLLRFPYNPLLGVRHGVYATGEETQVMMRMLDAGLVGWWTPEPRINHWIPRESQTPRYVRRWFVGCGKGELRSGDETAVRRAKQPWWIIKKALRFELRYQLRRHRVPPEEWIKDLMQAAKLQGIILGTAQMWTGRRWS